MNVIQIGRMKATKFVHLELFKSFLTEHFYSTFQRHDFPLSSLERGLHL